MEVELRLSRFGLTDDTPCTLCHGNTSIDGYCLTVDGEVDHTAWWLTTGDIHPPADATAHFDLPVCRRCVDLNPALRRTLCGVINVARDQQTELSIGWMVLDAAAPLALTRKWETPTRETALIQ